MIYLASASPRRQELLRQAGISFEALPSNIIEKRQTGEAPVDYVQRVAADKARFVARLAAGRGLPAHPVLGADTEVVMKDDILGKPRDRAHAAGMLRRLSGGSHIVLTAICLVTTAGEYSAVSESRVTFAELADTAITRYLATGEADDKAGAYAIQGRAAGFIARLEGSYSGVMGLPLYELFETLNRAGVEPT
ncbi:MAG TPA: nucleoside triphosphate pyrophosphatase [Acidiferrobacterales bacterium]|nr:nucleoside triphosphate pyrophosphatase [Acidiferrobacterales bacterium]